jgi:hypothetical protein
MDKLEALVLGQSLLLSPNLAYPSNGSLAGTPAANLSDHLLAIREGLLQNQRKKRRRVSSSSPSSPASAATATTSARQAIHHAPVLAWPADSPTGTDLLPPSYIVRELIELYFARIHPWIPIFHQPTFDALVKSSEEQPSVIILQAIVAATIKFYPLDHQSQERYHRHCHDAVVLTCMDCFSVETLQASIIIAFDTIGSVRGPRSWTIIASATRTVEQLGLAVEEEDLADNTLLNRIGFLPPAKSWTEAESLRRIFWCIFLMDRFCSVATGWNTSLTSTDVKRRLPVEGCYWRDEVEKKGRYFNIADHSVDSDDETNALGGFAYLIEASECLTRVVTFLLREPVDFSAHGGLRRWFNGYQRLDAMLVRWKTFLPTRWQVAGMDATGRMDENLTLAHLTHNTSVIMLHQNVAYPDSKFRLKLPSDDAAKTCMAAACEIATIAAKFVANTIVIITPALSFCLFVAGRAFLAHANSFNAPVDPNFDILLQSLREASTRWRARGPAFSSENLAGRFADRLDAALRGVSSINVRSAALEDHAGPQPEVSLASPPFPDVFQFASLPPSGLSDMAALWDGTSATAQAASMDEALANNNIPNALNVDTIDRIFTWTDDLMG